MIRDPFAHINLSDQEKIVLRFASEGFTDREIAARMSVSEKTIDTYWSRIRQKLEARNRTHAVAIAFKEEQQLDPLYGCEDLLKECEEGVWIIDMRGNTVYANHKLAEMFGYTIEEMQHINGWDLLDDEGRNQARKNAQDWPEGRRDAFKFRFKHRNGKDVWVLMTTSPITDDSGRQIRSMAMLNEIDAPTDVKLASGR